MGIGVEGKKKKECLVPLQITAEIIAGEEKCEKVCWASSTLFFTHLGPSFFFPLLKLLRYFMRGGVRAED